MKLKKAPLRRFGVLNLPLTDAKALWTPSCLRKGIDTGRNSLFSGYSVFMSNQRRLFFKVGSFLMYSSVLKRI